MGGKTVSDKRHAHESIPVGKTSDYYTGWAVTLQFPDGSLATVYGTTSHREQEPESISAEFVHWNLP